MKVVIDGLYITGKEKLHEYLQEILEFPEYYGKNLDALYDLLSTDDRELEFVIRHEEDLMVHLGEYCVWFEDTLYDVSEERENLSVEFESEDEEE